MGWLCCQLGAREHYAVARAFHGQGQLTGLITDAWVPPSHPLGRLKRSLRERYHPDLAGVLVHSANAGLLAFEARARSRGQSGWPLIMARNQWFQRHTVRSLKTLKTETLKTEKPTVFAYSYAALEIFRWAKAQGWRAVLGQIDPGPEMGRKIDEQTIRYEGQTNRSAPPSGYWESWREECALADRIVVNSAWSRDCLAREGIALDKITVVPLAYEPSGEAQNYLRASPNQFTRERPLRVLFLGQVTFLKGIVPLLEAVEQLQEAPIELMVVGRELCSIPQQLRTLPNVSWVGPVARGATAEFYRQADVFIFPSFCDGFGLTQLEAQAWRLPVIASRSCGDVVQDGSNGLLLPEVSADAIAKALRELVGNPTRLRQFSARSGVGENFGLKSLAAALLKL